MLGPSVDDISKPDSWPWPAPDVEALTAELEAARVEASDLAGQLRDVNAEHAQYLAALVAAQAERDQWQAARAQALAGQGRML